MTMEREKRKWRGTQLHRYENHFSSRYDKTPDHKNEKQEYLRICFGSGFENAVPYDGCQGCQLVTSHPQSGSRDTRAPGVQLAPSFSLVIVWGSSTCPHQGEFGQPSLEIPPRMHRGVSPGYSKPSQLDGGD